MDSLVAILKYVFKKGGIDSDITDIETLFFDEHSFLDFVKITFQVDEIPGVKKKAYSNHFQYMNIVKALNVIIQKNPEINETNASVDSPEERIEFVKTVLTLKCFTMTPREVLNKSNILLNTKYKNLSDIMNPTFLLTLLHKVSGNPIDKSTYFGGNMFNKLVNSFQKNLVPLVINEDSFKIENKFAFLIQVQIIFEIFADQITDIRNSTRLRPKNILLTNFNTKIEITEQAKSQTNQYYEKEAFYQEENGYGEFITNIDLEYKEWYPDEVREDEALLSTISIIAQELRICSLDECNSFEFTLYNNFIPLFVMRYLNIEKISGLKKINRSKKEKLSYQEVKNIKIVIEYLKKNEKKFELINFDFDSPHLFIYSTKSFFMHFLNTYFVKHTRIEMMERCHNLLGNLDWYSKPKLYAERRYDTFSGLLSIIDPNCEKNDENGNHLPCICYNDLTNLFKLAKVPMICGIDIMDEFYHDTDLCDSIYYQQSDKELPNSIIYQLQFIFNKIDSLPSLSVVEFLRLTNHKLHRINVTQFDLIKTVMNLKTRFIQLKSKIKKIDQKELDEMKNNQKLSRSNETTIQTFELRQNSSKKIKLNEKVRNKIDENDNKTSNEQLIDEEALKFWNLVDPSYQVEEEVLYSTKDPTEKTTEILKQFKSQEKAIKKEMSFKKEKTLRKKTLNPEENFQMNLLLQIRSSSFTFESRLYKLFYYDEEKLKWIYDSDSFSTLSDDKKINVEGSKTPLIFYFNSNEPDLLTINENFILGKYPQLDQDQIYIYALCEKHLGKLSIIPDFADQEKMLVKPIFLLLHIPKEKQKLPFISTIIKQIHFYLFNICDLIICLYNESHIKDQIEMLNEIIITSKHANKNTIEKNIILLKNNPNAKYKYNYDAKVHQLSLAKISEQQEICFYIVNFENFDSYTPFIDKLTEVSLKGSTFSDVVKYFNDFDVSHLSGMYFHIYNSNSWKDELKKIIEKRFLILKSNDPNFDKNPDRVLIKLQKEFSSFLPLNDKDICNEYIMNFSLIRKTFTKQNDDYIRKELQKSSDQNLANLDNILNEQDYITNNQINNMINSHIMFLKKEYFSIIKAISDENLFRYIYQDNFDILNNQIDKDKLKINVFSEKALKNFKSKNTTKNVNAEQASKKGTNYTLKEVENLKEMKVTIEGMNKLEKVIKQDF